MSFKEKVYGWKDYFEFEPVAQEEMSFKVFLVCISGSPFVRWSVAICAI